MALPNFRQAAISSNAPPPIQGAQTMMAGSPVSFNILKERLRSSPGGTQGGGFFFQGTKPDEVKANPFVQTQFGNSAFNPQRLGIRPVGGTGVPKPPRAPEKPLVPYMRYSRKIWDSVRNQNPDMKLWEIGKIIGQMWRDLPDIDKQEFQDEYDVEKQQYDKDLNAYKTSPGYLAYVQAKCRGNPVIEDPEPKGVRTAERRIDIQPAEDEEDPDDGLSVKHIAHGRFTRNHRLINEVFSETMVPDVRSVVTTARMQVLKRQVQSLTMHQKKLEAELTQIEEKYNQKKRKFLDSSEDFSKELKKHCAKVVDESKYNEMVNEQLEKLRMEREERARAGAPTPPSPTPPTDPADTRHVLQPVERGTDNPDSPQDEDGKTEKGKEKDEKDEKIGDSSALKKTTGNGEAEAGNAILVENKDGEKSEINDNANSRSEEPPLQYADMSNQKSLPTQPQMQVPPFNQGMAHGTTLQPQVPQQESLQSPVVPTENMQHSNIPAPVAGNMDVTSNQPEESVSLVTSQPVSTDDNQGTTKSPSTAAATPKNELDSQPSTGAAVADPSPPTNITPQSEVQVTPQVNVDPATNSALVTNADNCPPGQSTTAPNSSALATSVNVPPEALPPQPVPPNYTEIPPTSTSSGSQPLPPPPVQGVPPSYPPQQQSGVPYGHPTQAYGTDANTPYGSAPPLPAPVYPDPRYGGYHNYPPQPGAYPPPSEPYNVQATPQQIEPTASQAAAVAPGNPPNEANAASPSTGLPETVPVAGKDNPQPSNVGEASSNTVLPAAEVPMDTNPPIEQPSLADEKAQSAVTDQPADPADQKHSAPASTDQPTDE